MAGKKKRDPNRRRKKPRKKSGAPGRSARSRPQLDPDEESEVPLSDEEYATERRRIASEYGKGAGIFTKMRTTAGLRAQAGDGFFSRRRPLWVWALWFGGAYGAYQLARRFLFPILFPESADLN